ncbi:unnamed protein product [Eruca vesicaria subsp. sativa]|uniref:KIB1-4 beta-propeller domain-containing protein n=1 Tax=Eruca vesicaria subsp. sativa TaxID=29727 RepID=A0ABC8KFP0_ERUVS|nr:unnamed protein product [Eruca vesicaria subsp. sativa]
MSYLLLKDNIRASAVCKAWREATEHVRVGEKYPWIISFPTQGTLFDLFDPLQRKMYSLNLPDIAGMNVCFSKEGWLLMRKSRFVEFFFFNPYSRELISLPNCELPFQAIAFSSAPTSGTCVLVTLNPISEYLVAISICYPGETELINMEFPCSIAFDPNMHSNLIYANGHFYCFTAGGVLFDFDPSSRTLNQQAWDEPIFPNIHNSEWIYLPKIFYLMKQKGELFLMYTYGSETPVVYKLVSSKWEEMSSALLDGLTIFASRYCSETRMNVLGMRNSVYFPKYDVHNKQCVSYSYDEGRYSPCKQKELGSVESLWIEPPPCKDV